MSAIIARPFYFLRHGETDWNVSRQCIGQLDRPLTETGRAQAVSASAHCAGLEIAAVYYSPLSRAAQTAALVMHLRDVTMHADEGLLEACLGVKQGAREDDPQDPFIRDWIAGRVIDEAETYEGFKARVCTALNRCLANDHGAGVPLIVAHAGVYHALRDAMNVPVGKVHHCVPYVHTPLASGWQVETLPPR